MNVSHLLVFMAGEPHAIGRMESPMTIGVSEVDLINKKSK